MNNILSIIVDATLESGTLAKNMQQVVLRMRTEEKNVYAASCTKTSRNEHNLEC